MKVWITDDELYPDYEISITRPYYFRPGEGPVPQSGWDEVDLPIEVVRRYQAARERFMVAREALSELV